MLGKLLGFLASYCKGLSGDFFFFFLVIAAANVSAPFFALLMLFFKNQITNGFINSLWMALPQR